MKYFTFVLLVPLIIGLAAPATSVSARSNDDESQQDSSRGGYDDQDDEYEDDEGEYEDNRSDGDSYTTESTSTRPVVSTNVDSHIRLLQELLARLIALLNELKGGANSNVVTPATQVASSSALTYTAAVVATHNTTSSCWSIINSNVYDLTSYVSRHPGGSQNIIGICGKDGTSAFTGQHGGDAKPENILSGYYLSPLAR